MRLFFPMLIMAFTSCVTFPKLTDKAFYSIDDTSIRLVITHDKDSLLRTSYEITNNLPGSYCKNLSTTNKLDTSHKTGIAIRFWTSMVMNDENTAFYGEYAKKGLLDKIENIQISFANGEDRIEITQKLHGDSSTTAYMFRNYDEKKLPYGYSMTNTNCYYNPYFADIQAWKETINQKPHILKDIFHYDYIFWLDSQEIKRLTFTPEFLELKITLIDSTGLNLRQLADSIKIN